MAAAGATMDKFGTHAGITCDGCACRPIQGFRFKCKNCKNHDLCESCFERFLQGNLTQDPALARLNKVSPNIEDHDFRAFCEADGSFKSINTTKAVATPKTSKKVKPNEPCPCSSGKKYKKCCEGKK
mmetsp:Transcript_10123/g.32172  ORF Transcript_10123/g.32172 Transcript_10123/m.32172 type:complete len:127 (-) Transcript_10123:311-691(-)